MKKTLDVEKELIHEIIAYIEGAEQMMESERGMYDRGLRYLIEEKEMPEIYYKLLEIVKP
jgi:hypothetical protein